MLKACFNIPCLLNFGYSIWFYIFNQNNCALRFLTVPKHYELHSVFVYFVYLGFYVAFNTVQVISRRVVGRAKETMQYIEFTRVLYYNCRPTASNYQLSHLSPCRDWTPASEVGGESVTTLPLWPQLHSVKCCAILLYIKLKYCYILFLKLVKCVHHYIHWN